MYKIFESLQIFLQYSFVQRALIVGIMVSICTSLLGVTLVLKRFSFIGNSLSNVAFSIICICSILSIQQNLLIVIPCTILCSVVILSSEKHKQYSEDTALAMLSSGALAIGYMVMNIFPPTGNISGDVCTTLYGATSILTLSPLDVVISICMSLIIIILYVLFYKEIFLVTIDPTFAECTGIRLSVFNNVIAVLGAVIIVLAMKLVGTLLATALIIFPVATTMKIFKSYKSVMISSAVLSCVSSVFGIFTAIITGTPVGSTIVVINIILYICLSIIGRIHLW